MSSSVYRRISEPTVPLSAWVNHISRDKQINGRHDIADRDHFNIFPTTLFGPSP